MTEPVAAPFKKKPQAIVLFVTFISTAVVGLVLTNFLDSSRAGFIAAAAFAAVISAAMLISWGAEAAQFFMSQGFAVALIALLQVMPEFMVEAVIAWHGEIRNMFANATGSNRLLIGLGWPLIFFTADISSRLRTGKGVGEVRLRRENIIEVVSLLIASSWYVKLIVFGSLTLIDGVILAAMYITYMIVLARLPEEGEESKEDLLSPPRMLVEMPKGRMRLFIVVGIFVIGGGVMALVAHPFVESLKHVATSWGIREFLFIQWVAPFLSEFPEKVTAFYWSRTIRLAPMALLNMISSTVSQFTLLVGMIPIVYAISFFNGNFADMVVAKGLFDLPIVPMVTGDHDLRPEVFLSWAMTLLGCAILAKLRMTLADAVLIFFIWILQFLAGPLHSLTGIAEVHQHVGIGVACIVLAVLQVMKHWKHLEVRSSLRATLALLGKSRKQAHT